MKCNFHEGFFLPNMNKAYLLVNKNRNVFVNIIDYLIFRTLKIMFFMGCAEIECIFVPIFQFN